MTILNDPNEKLLVVIKSKVVDGKLTDSAAAALLRTEFNKYENTNDEVMISVAPFIAVAGGVGIMSMDEINMVIQKLKELQDTMIESGSADQNLDLMSEIDSWMSKACLAQASCLYYKESALSFNIENMPESVKSLQASERKAWAEAKTATYNSLYMLVERLNSKLTKKCDLLRTFVSYEKGLLGANAFQGRINGEHGR
jgi:hypothetical protein